MKETKKNEFVNNRNHDRHDVEGMNVHAKTVLNTEVEILDISISGCSVKSFRRFNIGGQYAFRFDLKDRPLVVKGIVIWEKLTQSKNVSKDEVAPIYSAGIKFLDVFSESGELLRDFIAEKMSDTGDRRLSGIRVRLAHAGKTMLSSIEANTVRILSLGGLSFETRQEIPIGTIIELDLILSESDTSIHCKGKIASSQDLPGFVPRRYEVGMEFVDMLDNDRLLLARFVETLPKNTV